MGYDSTEHMQQTTVNHWEKYNPPGNFGTAQDIQ